MLRQFFLILTLCLFLYSDGKVDDRIFAAPEFNVVDLSARRFSEGTILVVNGYVKNSSYENTSGRVIIYANQGNATILTLETQVNNGAPFAHGQKGFFEVSTNINPKQKMDTVLVEYIADTYIVRSVEE